LVIAGYLRNICEYRGTDIIECRVTLMKLRISIMKQFVLFRQYARRYIVERETAQTIC